MTTPAAGAGPAQQTAKRTIVIEGDAETLERQRKVSRIRESTIYCDEGTAIGGDGSAPTPMEYFLSSILF